MTTEVLNALREHGEKTEAQMAEVRARLLDIEQKSVVGSMPTARPNPLAKLVNDPQIRAIAARESKSAIVRLDGGIHMLTKSLIVSDTAGSGETRYQVQPTFAAGVYGAGQRPLSLLDFLQAMPVTSGSLTFNQLQNFTYGADYQSGEGAEKPEQDAELSLVTAPVATIAVHLPVSEQVLADSPMLQQALASLLSYGCRSKLEAEIIAGQGGAGEISGLTDSGNFTAYSPTSDDTLADAVSRAQANLDAAGWVAGLVIVHPNTWRDARNERESAGAGMYLAGSWRDPAPPSIWNVPVVTSTAVAADKFIVLDPSQAMVLDRQQASVELGRVNDQFTRNIITMRAELRAGLAVMAPGAVLYGDWTA